MRGPGFGEISVAATIWTGVFWLLVILAIGAFAFFIARMVTDRRPADAVATSAAAAPAAVVPGARAILDERLAKGEIDVDDYRARLAAIESPGAQ